MKLFHYPVLTLQSAINCTNHCQVNDNKESPLAPCLAHEYNFIQHSQDTQEGSSVCVRARVAVGWERGELADMHIAPDLELLQVRFKMDQQRRMGSPGLEKQEVFQGWRFKRSCMAAISCTQPVSAV